MATYLGREVTVVKGIFDDSGNKVIVADKEGQHIRVNRSDLIFTEEEKEALLGDHLEHYKDSFKVKKPKTDKEIKADKERKEKELKEKELRDKELKHKQRMM